MNEFSPDRDKEEAIAKILGCDNFVLVTETKLDITTEDMANGNNSPVEWEVFSNCSKMTIGGLLSFGSKIWERNVIIE